MKEQRGSRSIALPILDLGTWCGWWLKPRPGRFTPWVRFLVSIVEETEWTSRSVWMAMRNRKSLENCALLGYYAACSGNSLPTFRDNSSRILDPGRLDTLGCPETSVRNYHYTLRNSPEERSCRKPLFPTRPQAPNQAARSEWL